MAMEDSGSMMSPADIAALTKGNGFGDGNGLSWLVLIILFFGFMGGGFGWNRNGELGQYATAASQLSQCCCTTQRGIDSVNYNGAINTAAINKNIDDKFAALEKAGLERQIQEQAAKISALELASQMAGVVKYPMSYAYSAGQSPFCGCSGCYAPSV